MEYSSDNMHNLFKKLSGSTEFMANKTFIDVVKQCNLVEGANVFFILREIQQAKLGSSGKISFEQFKVGIEIISQKRNIPEDGIVSEIAQNYHQPTDFAEETQLPTLETTPQRLSAKAGSKIRPSIPKPSRSQGVKRSFTPSIDLDKSGSGPQIKIVPDSPQKRFSIVKEEFDQIILKSESDFQTRKKIRVQLDSSEGLSLIEQKQLRENFICQICVFVVIEPETCQACGSLFCRVCIKDWNLKQGSALTKKCPLCQNVYAAQNMNRVLRNILDGIQFKDSTFRFKSITYQQKVTQLLQWFHIECPLQCNLNPNDLIFNQLQEHLTLYCPKMNVECNSCSYILCRGQQLQHNCISALKLIIDEQELIVKRREQELESQSKMLSLQNQNTIESLQKEKQESRSLIQTLEAENFKQSLKISVLEVELAQLTARLKALTEDKAIEEKSNAEFRQAYLSSKDDNQAV